MADGTGGRAPPGLGQGQASHAPAAGRSADFQAVTADWITIWQSELAAMATDRETHEAWVRFVALWARAAGAAARFLPQAPAPRADGPGGYAGSAAPPGAAAAMAAPDARDAAIQHLADRVDELERRIKALTAGPSSMVANPKL
jgi:hypothetical protein